MVSNKTKRLGVYILLGFVFFLYVLTLFMFLFAELQVAILVFAYSTFFTIVLYFLFLLQKRFEASSEEKSKD